MTTGGRPLPKFGEWDVNNPASADGFTVIFNKARDQKKSSGTAVGGLSGGEMPAPHTNYHQQDNPKKQHKPSKWLCCVYGA